MASKPLIKNIGTKLTFIKESTLNSYSLVFFSDNKWFGFILLLISFMDLWAGLSGLLSVFMVNSISVYLGYSKYRVNSGHYAYNSLLVGIGTGLTLVPGPELFAIVLFAAIFTFFLSIALEGILAKYYLPYISIPFILGLWMVILASRDLSLLGLSSRGIFTTNELYLLGGKWLSDLYIWSNNLPIPHFIQTYLLALGAIFFQYNLPAGLLIAIGLFAYSRISFLLSLLGFGVAYYFYGFLGADIAQYGYSYIGFNYILTAIALGGHFLVPSRQSFTWVVILLPIVVLLSLGLSRILAVYQLPVYSLPFNFVVLLFLYSLKLRVFPNSKLGEVMLQLNNPEKNLYFHQQARSRFKWLEFFPISLPFHGEWTVSQAHHGDITHKGEWAHAWDFIILDKLGNQFRGEGNLREDYYCYNKFVVSPSYGYVVEIIDGIEDNEIGQANLVHNWGNSIVIKHTEYLYTQISHLKPGSFKVKKGDYLKKGDTIAQCGNSGRSPYPHLHFQVQATPFIGSKTLDYPLDHYIESRDGRFDLHSWTKPGIGELVSNIKIEPILKNALNFTPGQELLFSFTRKNKIKSGLKWEIHADTYNHTYIYCSQSKSFAYFLNDSNLIYFKNFVGSKKSALYHFYLAMYHVPFGFYPHMKIRDNFPVNLVYNRFLLLFQDLLAPFYLFLKSTYILNLKKADNLLSPTELEIESQINTSFFGKTKEKVYRVLIDKKGISQIICEDVFLLERIEKD